MIEGYEHLISLNVGEIHCGSSLGTGFFVLPDRMITCYHVVKNHVAHKVVFIWNGQVLFPLIDLELSSEELDIAVFRIPENKRHCLPVYSGYTPSGSFYSFGYARYELGYRGLPVRGQITGLTKQTSENVNIDLILLGECSIEDGMSGGPLFDVTLSSVVGVVKRTSSKGGGYAIPMTSILRVWPSLANQNENAVATSGLVDSKIRLYLAAVAREHEFVQMVDLQREIRLAEIYVTLTVVQKARSGVRFNAQGKPIRDDSDDVRSYHVWSDRGSEPIDEPEFRVVIDLAEVLALPCVILLGDPGAGKTTLLRHIAYNFATTPDTRVPIPIFVRLADLANTPNISVTDYLKVHMPVYSDVLIEYMLKGSCTVFLDGLDEVPDNLIHSIQTEALRLSAWKNQVIITCRTVAYRSGFLPCNFREFEVLGFNRTQQRDFLFRWYIGDTTRARILDDEIQKDPSMSSLSKNPLLLSLMAVTAENEPKFSLPTSRVELYTKASELLLDRWRLIKGLPQPKAFSKRGRELLLESIASDSFLRDRDLQSEADLLEHIDKWVSEIGHKYASGFNAEQILEILCRDNGFLSKHADTEYRFLHLTFQEYYTARALLRRSDMLSLVNSHCCSPRWEEVLRLLCGLSKDATEIVDTIWQPQVKDDSFRSRLFLAGRCLGDAKKAADFTVQRVSQEIATALFAAETAHLYTSAARALAVLTRRFPRSLQYLFELANQGDPNFVYFIRCCGSIRNPELSGFLVNQLQNKCQDLYDLRELIYAIGATGDMKAMPALLALLQHEDPNIASSAAAAAASLVSSDHTQELVCLLNHQSEFARLGAAYVLGHAADSRAIPHLLKRIMVAAETPLVRRAIENALLSFVCIQDLLELLQSALSDDTHIPARASYLRILGTKAKAFVRKPLLDNLDNAFTDEELLFAAAVALFSNSQFSAHDADYLLKVCKDRTTSSSKRRFFISLIGRSASPYIAAHLTEIAIDKMEEKTICAAAARAILQTESARLEDLEKLFADNEGEWFLDIQLPAVMALGGLRTESALDRVNLFLVSHATSPVCRRAAYIALGNSGNMRAVPILLSQLTSETDPGAQRVCVVALGQVCDPAAIRALINISESYFLPAHTRIPAILALWRYASMEVRELFEKILFDPMEDPVVRDVAMRTLWLYCRVSDQALPSRQLEVIPEVGQRIHEQIDINTVLLQLEQAITDESVRNQLNYIARRMMSDGHMPPQLQLFAGTILRLLSGDVKPPLQILPTEIRLKLEPIISLYRDQQRNLYQDE